MTPETVSDEEPQPQGLGEVSRLTGVFFEPTKTFQDIAARPNFWVPLIIIMVTSITFLALFSQHVGWERMMRQQTGGEFADGAAFAGTARDAASDDDEVRAGGRLCGVLVFVPLGTLIWAAILLLIVKTMMGAPVRLKQIYAVHLLCAMPGLIFSRWRWR